MPTVAIETDNNAIARGDQNAATEDAASISPSRSTSGNDAVISTMIEISRGDESNDGPIRYRNIADILRDAPRVELEEEIEEEAFLTEEGEPSCYREVAGQAAWEHAMKKEMEAIERNATWSLTELPVGHKIMGLKWVFKLKKNSNGEIIKHKA